MKKFIPLLILLFISTLSVSAQGKKKQRTTKTETTDSRSSSNSSSRSKAVKDGSSDNPRSDRSIAITSETGFKSLSGFGLNGTYYVQPKIAIDLGLGLGVQVFKGGIRGRYLFLDKKFSPYAGAGVFFNPLAIEDLAIDDGNNFGVINVDSSTFGQVVFGAEFMADIGFVVGFNVGYAASLSGNNWTAIGSIDPDLALIPDILYNSGVSFAFNIGWAF